MKRIALLMTVATFSTLTFNACSKSDGPDGGNNKNVKFTITVEGSVESNDLVSFDFSGGTLNSSENTIWKVNGATRNNETDISLGENEFSGSTKTYIVESIMPLAAAGFVVHVVNFDAPLKVTYKAEVNGKVVNNDAPTITGDGTAYAKQFTY